LNQGLGTFTINNQLLLTLLSGAQLGMAIPSQVIPSSQQAQQRKQATQIVAQPPLLLDFTTGNASQTVHFDDNSNMFATGALPN
jgi:hypothetical protein